MEIIKKHSRKYWFPQNFSEILQNKILKFDSIVYFLKKLFTLFVENLHPITIVNW